MLNQPVIRVRFRPFHWASVWWPETRVWWVVFYHDCEESASNGPHTYEEAHENRVLNQHMYKQTLDAELARMSGKNALPLSVCEDKDAGPTTKRP